MATVAVPVFSGQNASAEGLLAEEFTGASLAGSWLSGGNPNSACLTASMSSSGAIRGCDTEVPLDEDGEGALRLTSNQASQAGFVINQTPLSTEEGLQISFDMYQYDGSGADGIAFFLIDGSKNPTQPGAFGGSLGYSSNTDGDPGLVGGYVGVGFDVYGNFSNPEFGTGGPGAVSNSITVRGSEATGYRYVTKKSASGDLANNEATDRNDAKRHVVISISTNNVMTVYVDYGEGLVKELSGIDLNTINGAGSLPESLKFGFSASTGGSNNIHEITGLSVDPLAPNVKATATQNGTWYQGETGTYTITAKNDAGAEETRGEIMVRDVISTPVTVTGVSGEGWTCQFTNVHVPTCTRPGDGENALAPGATLPPITVTVAISPTSPLSVSHNTVVNTTDNNNVDGSDNFSYFHITRGDLDGYTSGVEDAAPNDGDANDDGTADTEQANVTSFVNSITNNYVALETSGDCEQNITPSVIRAVDNDKTDASYLYPVGMMDFSIDCDTPGGTTTVTQYYFGDFDASQYVARKYNATTQTYDTIPGATLTNVTIGGEAALKISYEITDGGALDADGLANGTIVDPAGPALEYVAVSPDAGTPTSPTSTLAVAPGVPNTGNGVHSSQPLLTLLVASLGAAGLLGLSRYLAKRYN